MIAKPSHIEQENGFVDASAELRRIAADMLRNSPVMSVHPMMAHPAAAIAAMTAIGFGISTQLAGAFLGALQGAVEAANRLAPTPDKENGFVAVTRTAEAAKAEPVQAMPPAQATTIAKPVKVRAEETKPAHRKAPARAAAKAAIASPKPSTGVARARKASVAKGDDLKKISGIGPKLVQVLNERGILSFADIASWSEADVRRIDAELGFDGRIGRDDWVGQAKALMPKTAGRK